MSLKGEAIVWRGRLAYCVDIVNGDAMIAWVDVNRERIVRRRVPAASCKRYRDAVSVRSAWPIAAHSNLMALEEPAYKAARNRKRLARHV